jgi:hypothetical protein
MAKERLEFRKYLKTNPKNNWILFSSGKGKL